MQVPRAGSIGSLGSGAVNGKGSSRKMSAAEVTADIFNNAHDPEDEKRDVKLRLSNTVRFMNNELRKDIKKFLVDNRVIAKELDKIEVPENEYTPSYDKSDLTIRKLGMFLRWLNIQENHNEEKGSAEEKDSEPNPLDESFRKIHKENKSKEILKIYQDFDAKRKELHFSRKKTVPNYYYLVYPETYSFN